MATQPAPKRVRYKALQRSFVNGNLVEPGSYVMAPPGLEGKALKLAPEGAPEPPDLAPPPPLPRLSA